MRIVEGCNSYGICCDAEKVDDQNNEMSHVWQRGGDSNPENRCNPVCIRPKGAAHASNEGLKKFIHRSTQLSYSAQTAAEAGLEPATHELSTVIPSAFACCAINRKKGGRLNWLVVFLIYNVCTLSGIEPETYGISRCSIL